MVFWGFFSWSFWGVCSFWSFGRVWLAFGPFQEVWLAFGLFGGVCSLFGFFEYFRSFWGFLLVFFGPFRSFWGVCSFWSFGRVWLLWSFWGVCSFWSFGKSLVLLVFCVWVCSRTFFCFLYITWAATIGRDEIDTIEAKVINILFIFFI